MALGSGGGGDSATGSRPPTLEDVAQLAGVSRATVSRVINGIRNVNPELHKVVWNAVGVTGYVPNRAARSLVTGRTGTVALVVSDSVRHDDDPFMSRFFADPFFGRVVGGLLSVLRPGGVQLALQFVGDRESRERLIGDLRQGRADGAIVLSLHPQDGLPGMLVNAGIAAVLIGRPATPAPISYVDLANDAGAALAADHLYAACGRRRIAMISGPAEVPASQDRIAGFRRALARHGQPFVPCVEGNFTYDSGERAMRHLLSERAVDGLFVANDLMAQGALMVLRDANLRVPQDVAVVGFDDSSAALAARPTLTTIRHPLEDMAAESARMLLARVADPATDPSSVIFEPTLVVRQSA
ncbi:LacI family DNA-binding transcriptional regulator [Rhizomonospora bruguierae]|uniref:LacI family DNA-binding transcriptional regulator n=1 Tax=Rhizomonospora bruguierae TaxID=1581705 RepID=UPI001BCD79B1|nr:LacI family DNA-binding transcriptional regulator [Micromonospora sp. NBRC 107566]